MSLGRADVDGLLEEITWEQFCGWVAYAEMEPWGEQRADLRMGIEASSIVNTLRQVNSVKRLRRDQLSKPTDFIPRFGEEQPKRERVARKALTDPDAWGLLMGDLKAKVARQARGSA